MSLNFDQLRKKLASLKGQNNFSVALWKPKPGKCTIRILPWKENAESPFCEMLFHHLGGKTQLSPLTTGKPDPIAEFADKLRETRNKDDYAMARQFTPQLRVFVPVIVRGEEEKGVRFWGFSKKVYEEIVTVMMDSDWGDITHPTTGRDIGIEYIDAKDSDTKFAKTNIRVKPNQTPASDNAVTLDGWLKTQPDIREVFSMPTYEDLQTFLENNLNPSAQPAPVAKTETSPAPATAAVVPTSTTTPVVSIPAVKDEAETPTSDNDVAAEFEKLFSA